MRDGPCASSGFRARKRLSLASRVTRTMRWARTGAHLTGQAWLEDYLTGLLWYLGVLLLVGVLAWVVHVVT